MTEWIGTSETARLLGITYKSAWNLYAEGWLPARKEGTRILFDKAAVLERQARLQASAPDSPPGYITTAEAALLLGMARDSVHNLVEHGRLPGQRVGNRLMVPLEAVEREAAKRRGGLLAVDKIPAALHSEEMDTILDACQPEQWREAGWELRRGEATCTVRRHRLVEVHVGLEIGLMCGACGRVYLTGRIDQRLAKYAAQRNMIQEAS